MKHYSINKDKELPKSGRSFGRLLDLSKMDVGDCFSFPTADEARVKALVDAYGKKNGASFLMNFNDHGTCWRTA
jgi:hypothetical protein